jgi:PAS domain S-box-containing protein
MVPEPGPVAEGEPPDFVAPSCSLEAILDAIPFPLHLKAPDGRVLTCNRAFEEATGRSRRELAGTTARDFMLLQEAEDITRRDRERLLDGGSGSFLTSVTTPGRGVLELQVHKALLRGRDGAPAGIATTIEDVTERRRAEKELRRSQELLATITSHVTDLMAIVDQDGRRLFSSPSYQTILGYPPDELAAGPPLALVHPEDQPRVREALAAVIEQHIPQAAEYRLRHREGRWLFFETRINPVFPEPGQPFRALIVARDITGRKAAEQERQQMEIQLRHAQKLEFLGSMAAGIAHEINTPTQYIGDNATFLNEVLPGLLDCVDGQRRFLLHLRDRQALPAGGAELLEQITRLDLDYLAEEVPKAIRQTLDGVARVSTIVRAMKDFAHPGGEAKTATDLNAAIRSTLLVSRSEWKYVATLETDLDPGLPLVPCVPGEINQAVLNLVVNAAHAIEEQLGQRNSGQLGLIRISTRRLEDEVRISVSDTGAGIPEAIRDRIFEPFFTTKPIGRGTGQGLAIVYAVVVDRHGGRVTLDTETGRGTTFHLHLPLPAQEHRTGQAE